MNVIHLHGELGSRFQPSYRLKVRSAAEAIRALSLQVPEFRDALLDGSFQVIKGDLATGCNLGSEEELHLGLGDHDLHILPADLDGEGGGKGIGKVILGVVLIAAAFFTGGASLGASGIVFSSVAGQAATYLGMSLLFSGVSMMLTPAPKISNANDQNDEKQSFLPSGAINVSGQGYAVPPVYGRFRVGSISISTGVTTEQIAIATHDDGETYDPWTFPYHPELEG